MAKLYIMCGLAFSGKSTLSKKMAESMAARRFAFDEMWVEEEKKGPVPNGTEGWQYIRELAKVRAAELLSAGESVIYDENNPRREHREEFGAVADRLGLESVVVYLNTPLDLIRARELENRSSQERHEVEAANFEKVLKDMEVPTDEENVIAFSPDMDAVDFIGRL